MWIRYWVFFIVTLDLIILDQFYQFSSIIIGLLCFWGLVPPICHRGEGSHQLLRPSGGGHRKFIDYKRNTVNSDLLGQSEAHGGNFDYFFREQRPRMSLKPNGAQLERCLFTKYK